YEAVNPNVGGNDRTMRLVSAGLLALLGTAGLFGVVPLEAFSGAVVLVTGVVLGVTGLLRRCPMNALVGVDTCTVDEPERPEDGG
ncbi:MAG: DUF2892 domain-containing protein, partial [Halobacteriales archaeon]|nr:DUF2892 domain-containing protein [Halobacteriales archaeon]